jgi:hypothetical protein
MYCVSVDGRQRREVPWQLLVVEAASGTRRARLDGKLRQVAGERGLLGEPLPKTVPNAVLRLLAPWRI